MKDLSLYITICRFCPALIAIGAATRQDSLLLIALAVVHLIVEELLGSDDNGLGQTLVVA